MSKVKIKRASTAIDMTAMCDVAFLLLTFFMLTAKAKPQETVTIDTPSSISDTKLPETDILTISVDAKGKTYFNVDNPKFRMSLIQKMNTDYDMKLSNEDMLSFTRIGSIGVPRSQLKAFLALEGGEQAKVEVPGVPVDTSNNELGPWIQAARYASGNAYRIVVKGDGQAEYPAIERVISTLQSLNINKFNLITDLEQSPNKTTAVMSK